MGAGVAMPGAQQSMWGPRPPAPPPPPMPASGPGSGPGPPGTGSDDWWNINPVTGGKWDDTNTVRQLIQHMLQGGFFNPYGTPGYRDMYASAGQQMRQDSIGRAETAADIRGLTPEQAQFARTMAGVNAESGAARGYADFNMQDALSNRDWIRKLMEMQYTHNYTPKLP
jgi:hypothetical protein